MHVDACTHLHRHMSRHEQASVHTHTSSGKHKRRYTRTHDLPVVERLACSYNVYIPTQRLGLARTCAHTHTGTHDGMSATHNCAGASRIVPACKHAEMFACVPVQKSTRRGAHTYMSEYPCRTARIPSSVRANAEAYIHERTRAPCSWARHTCESTDIFVAPTFTSTYVHICRCAHACRQKQGDVNSRRHTHTRAHTLTHRDTHNGTDKWSYTHTDRH
jgi:hypothetical protein